jgi:hypothetical protein
MNKQNYDPACYNRQSLRLPTYDYSSNGAYFVTICLQERQPLLEIPELHTILEDTWNTLPQRFPTVTLDDFIIMPDHVIRSEFELQQKRTYIRNNPIKEDLKQNRL